MTEVSHAANYSEITHMKRFLPTIESVESRRLLTVSWLFNESIGKLEFEFDAGDSIRFETSNGQTLLNGQSIESDFLDPAAILSIDIRARGNDFDQTIEIGDFPELREVRLQFPGSQQIMLGATTRISVHDVLLIDSGGIRMEQGAAIESASDITFVTHRNHTCLTQVVSASRVTLRADLFEAFVDCGTEEASIVAKEIYFDTFHGPLGSPNDPLDVQIDSLEGICDCPLYIAQHGDLTLAQPLQAEGLLAVRTLAVDGVSQPGEPADAAAGDLMIRHSIAPTIDYLAYEFSASGDFELHADLSGRAGDLGGGSVLIESGNNVLVAETATINSDHTTVRSRADAPSQLQLLGEFVFGGIDLQGGSSADEISFAPTIVDAWSEAEYRLDGREGGDVYRVASVAAMVTIRDTGTAGAVDRLIFDAEHRSVIDTGTEIVVDGVTRVDYRGIEVVQIVNLPVPGDFSGDGLATAADIDLLHAAIAAEDHSPAFDLTGDSRVDSADVDFLVTQLLNTRCGDTNLDGRVAIGDFVTLAQHFGQAAAGWAHGDFDGNGRVDFGDFVQLARNFGFERETVAESL